jgi:aminoglycoside phosphotransferase (APT) family kinase protein
VVSITTPVRVPAVRAPKRAPRHTAAVLADELLETARSVTGRADVEYAEPPVRLSGGFFTENHAFCLTRAPAPWDGPLVVRLFPGEAPPDLARREATVQRVLAGQGYPAPAIVWFDDDARLAERRCFVMRRLPGHPLVGGIRPRELLMSLRKLYRQVVEMTASAQAALHRLDAAPIVAELDDMPLGVERWYERMAQFEGFAAGLDWLVAHRPPDRATPVVCHGDLHPGNLLVEGDRLTGVLDYTVMTIAEPALDVGYTAMSLHIAPIDAPAPVQRVAARFARGIADRYVAAYLRQTGADLTNQRYYEALRCASELTNVASYRLARAAGTHQDAPRPTWDAVGTMMVEYFRERTGVTLVLPPPVGRDPARAR